MNKIEEFLIQQGFDLNELKNDNSKYAVKNMEKAAERIKAAVKDGRHIYVFADYDCDGIMSGSIMYLILTELGADFTIRFPKRMSEGYGLQVPVIDDVPANSVLITVDNGISSVEAIQKAKDAGLETIIIDHHIARDDGIIPDADVVVDAHVFYNDGDFDGYCGAGLSYKLAEYLNCSKKTIKAANILASFATIQDVVPLVKENRRIVKNGLYLLNNGECDMEGVVILCRALKLVPSLDVHTGINEEDIGFQIGPCINAMGRMLDDGAQKAFEYLMLYEKTGEDGIMKMIDWNAERKTETSRQQDLLAQQINISKKDTCIVCYAPGLHEGLIGINAAKICEQYNMPAIVFTDAEDGTLKGSARSTEDVNMKDILDKISDLILKFGGHAGAAGLSIEKSKLKEFTKAMNANVPKSTVVKSTWKFDFEALPDEISALYEASREYAPFGEAFPAPLVKVNNYNLIKNYGRFFRYIGDNGVSFNGNGTECVSFSLKEKYVTLGEPLKMNVIGTLGWSRYSRHPQLQLTDFQEIGTQKASGFLI